MENGRIVVVTGGAGGIGSKIVDRFLANGDTIFAIDNRSDALQDLLETRNAQDRLVAVEGDVSKEDDVRGFADTIRAKAGRVDVLINCAGYYPIVSFEKMTFADWQQVIAINLTGGFLMVSSLLALMKGRGWGRIVNIASASIFEGVVGTDALRRREERPHWLFPLPRHGSGRVRHHRELRCAGADSDRAGEANHVRIDDRRTARVARHPAGRAARGSRRAGIFPGFTRGQFYEWTDARRRWRQKQELKGR
jgi:NADPH:quinone reductase-like Zn-dependent oxidoreductase